DQKALGTRRRSPLTYTLGRFVADRTNVGAAIDAAAGELRRPPVADAPGSDGASLTLRVRMARR
ncbi:MAG: hypothetical protein C4547_10010, partial [Phycisphaerales bacterium]